MVLSSEVNKLGIATTSFLAILGAAGLAVGLALKDSLGNFASGVMIILFKPFKVGDLVTAAGVTGTITEVGIFNSIFFFHPRIYQYRFIHEVYPKYSMDGRNVQNYIPSM